MRKEIRRFRPSAAVAVAAVVVVLIGCGISVFTQSLQQALYEERAYHMDETAAQITATIDATLEDQWSQLKLSSLYVKQHAYMNAEKLSEGLHEVENEMTPQGLMLAVVDNKGVFIRTDGSEFKTGRTAVLGTDGPERQIIIEQANIIDNSERMVFLLRLEKPVVLADGRVITHVTASRKMSVYSESFRSDAYRGQNEVFILDNRGSKVYQDTKLHSFLNSLNVLNALEMAKIKNGDTIEDIHEGIRRGHSTVTLIEGGGEAYFVTVQPMAYSDWNVLMAVPETCVSSRTSDFAGTILRITLLFTASIFVAVLVTLLLWARATSENKLLRQEYQSNAALAAAAEEAARANKAKTDFLSHISHDVRTPINGIIGMLSIAERNIDNMEIVRECYGKIRTVSDHLLSLINDILDISKLESGKAELREEPFSMHETLENCCSIFQDRLERDGIAFHTDFSGIIHDLLLGSELHLRKILLNILGNAAKYTEKGFICFSVRELSDNGLRARYQFEIRDTGIGMSEEFQKHIFQPFQQENGGARTNYEGTGLGMTIVKEIVDQMGGTIALDSRLGEGSTFRVELSFTITDSPPARPEAKQEEVPDLSGMCILLVEDNEINIEVIEMYLEGAGASVDVATDGKEAVTMFTSSAPGRYDLILMDVLMPVMDGMQAAQAIRQSGHPEAQTIPIIAQTANAFAEDIEAVKATGMNDHIAKPINETQLLRLVYSYKQRRDEQT